MQTGLDEVMRKAMRDRCVQVQNVMRNPMRRATHHLHVPTRASDAPDLRVMRWHSAGCVEARGTLAFARGRTVPSIPGRYVNPRPAGSGSGTGVACGVSASGYVNLRAANGGPHPPCPTADAQGRNDPSLDSQGSTPSSAHEQERSTT